MSKQPAIIVDLDSTLCLFHDTEGNAIRSLYYTKKEDSHHYLNDQPNEVLMDMLQLYLEVGDVEILFVTGRTETFREVTVQWLMKYSNDVINPGAEEIYRCCHLFMRGDGDYRHSNVIKQEVYKQYIEPKYEVLFVLEDRACDVKMWRELGLTCLQVAPGDF